MISPKLAIILLLLIAVAGCASEIPEDRCMTQVMCFLPEGYEGNMTLTYGKEDICYPVDDDPWALSDWAVRYIIPQVRDNDVINFSVGDPREDILESKITYVVVPEIENVTCIKSTVKREDIPKEYYQ